MGNKLTQVGEYFFSWFLKGMKSTCPSCIADNKPYRVTPSGVLIHLIDGGIKACDGINVIRSKGRA